MNSWSDSQQNDTSPHPTELNGADVTEISFDPSPPPKKRGRPPGSTSKPRPAEPHVEADVVQPAQAEPDEEAAPQPAPDQSPEDKPTDPESSYAYWESRAIRLYQLWRERREKKAARALATKPSRSERLEARVHNRDRIGTILLTVASAGTALMTYFGVSVPLAEIGGGLIQKGLALSFSLSVATLSWIGWYYVFGLVPELSRWRISQGAGAAIVYLGLIAAIDAQMIMLALAGAPATQMSLVDTATYYETQRNLVFDQTTKVRKLVPAIEVQAKRFADLEQQELQGGAQSGKKGPGKVSAGFAQLATILGGLAEELNEGLALAEGIQGDITTTLGEIKAQVYVQGPIRSRMAAASAGADKLDEMLARLSQYDYATSVSVTADTLASAFPASVSASSEFEGRQNAELARIGEMATPVAEILSTALDDLSKAPDGATEKVRPLEPGDAVKAYWQRLLPEWIAAIFIDVAPFFLLLILIVAQREVEARRKTETTGEDS